MARSKLHPTMARNCSTGRQQSIQTLFLQREDIYDLKAAARLTGRTPRQLRREVEAGRDATVIDGALCFTWRQVAFLALDRYGLAEIHDALGGRTLLPSCRHC